MSGLGSYTVKLRPPISNGELKRQQAARHNQKYEAEQVRSAAELIEREELRAAMKAEVTDAFHEVEKRTFI